MYYAKGSYVSANWFTKHVTRLSDPDDNASARCRHHADAEAGALATKANCRTDGRGQAVSAQEPYSARIKQDGIIGPFFGGQPGDSSW